jgi:hypothetical protein
MKLFASLVLEIDDELIPEGDRGMAFVKSVLMDGIGNAIMEDIGDINVLEVGEDEGDSEE